MSNAHYKNVRLQTFQDTCSVCDPIATTVTSRGAAEGSVH